MKALAHPFPFATRRALGAAMIALLAAPVTAEPASLDDDTRAALAVLEDLAPRGQAGVIAGMEQSHRAGEMGEAQVPLLAALIEAPAWTVENRRRVAFLLTVLGRPAEASLDRLSFSQDAAVREMAIDALRWIAAAERLQSPDPRVREHAAQEVVAFAGEHPAAVGRAVEALTAAYTRQDESRREVRVAALRALVQFGTVSAPALVRSFENPDAFFYRYGKAALKALGDSAEDALLEGLQHPNPLVRQRVVYVLREMEIDADTAEAIRRLENDPDESVRKAVAKALASRRAP